MNEQRSNPYVGPRSFQRGENLYGRNRETQRLFDLLLAERIVLLYSPSGAGKTSLINAALIPRLLAEDFHVWRPMRVNAETPGELARSDQPVNRFVLSALLSLEEDLPREQQKPLAELAHLSLNDYLTLRRQAGEAAESHQPDGQQPARAELLIFDQFEEIVFAQLADQNERIEFFQQLGAALRDPGRWALFAMREDFIAALDPYVRYLPTYLRNTFRLDLLGPEAARAAMQKPAGQAGVDFTDEAARKLADDLRRVRVQRLDGTLGEQPGPYVEPVQLQVICFRLWEQLPAQATAIYDADVASVGDVDTVLANYYADRVMTVAQATAASERAIRDWFDQELITAQGVRGQVLYGSEQSQQLGDRAIRQLIDAHLVRAEERRGATWFELAHDRLIEPIRKSNAAWREAHLSPLQRQAELWEQQDRAEGLLLRGTALTEAESWAKDRAPELTDIEQDFLAACRKARAAEQRERRNNRLIRGLAVAALLALAVAIAGVIIASQQTQIAQEQKAAAEAASKKAAQQQATAEAASKEADKQRAAAVVALDDAQKQRAEAERQSKIAFARQLSAQSLVHYDRQFDLAVLLGLETAKAADSATDTYEGRNRLLDVLESHPRLIALRQSETEVVYSVAFSPDGKTLASGGCGEFLSGISCTEGNITLWDVSNPQTIKALSQPLAGHTRSVNSVAFSPDGKTLATGSEDTTIILWDVSNPQTPKALGQPLSGHTAPVNSLVFSPDGQTLASGGGYGDGTIILWDVSNPRAPKPLGQSLAGHTASVWSVAFSSDGQTLASGSDDKTIILWDVSNPQTPKALGQPLTGHTEGVSSVSFSPDGKTLASGSQDRKIILWDVADPQAPRAIGQPLAVHTHAVLSVAFSSDGQTLASGSGDNTIILWDVSNPQAPKPLGQPLSGHTASVLSVAFSPDGQTLASGGGGNIIILWDVANPQAPKAFGQPLTGHTAFVRSVAFSPDSKTLASGGCGIVKDDGSCPGADIILWDMANPQAPKPLGQPLAGHTASVLSVTFSPNGQTLASGNGDTIILWDVSNPRAPKPLGQPLAEHTNTVFSVAFSRDGQTLASSGCGKIVNSMCYKNTIMLWDVSNPQVPKALGQTLFGDYGYVVSVAFSPDGKMLASGDGTMIILWDVSNPRVPKSLGQPLAGHTAFVRSVAFSPDGQTLASGDMFGTIILWDVSNPQVPPQPLSQPLAGRTGSVLSVTFSPNGQTLASGDGNTIILWDVSNPRAPKPLGQPLTGHTDAVRSVAVSPDGKTLASGSADKTIILWDIDPESWKKRACEMAGRNFTQTEWQQYFGERGEPYRKTCEQWPEGK